MTWSVDAELEDALWAAARARIPQELHGGPGLSAAVVDRSRRYTSDRDHLAAPASATADLAARALFFTIADAAKIRVPLAELAARGLDPRDRIRVLDVGAGCGAMTLGIIAHVAPGTSIDAALIDRDEQALAIAADAIRAYAAARGVTIAVTTRRADVSAIPSGTFDLVVAGSVVNELPPPARARMVERMLEATASAGATIVIEPALKSTARDLHAVRDDLLARGVAHVFAPCTRQVARCPMLDTDRDWCHEDRPLQLPPRAMRIAINTGLRDAGMKMSYLVLRHMTEPLVPAGALARRVVSEPMKSKGKLELYGCSDEGRLKLRLLQRNRTDANRAFERARRGDVLVGIGGTEVDPDEDVGRITPAGD
ncbi:MAG TPA: small ribosomal subunit Rsm22 family protein [Kofleriaceae bacterium]|nr:small ribosomal subunit Rsm22 family protein [Kofleriaceae bacterium]